MFQKPVLHESMYTGFFNSIINYQHWMIPAAPLIAMPSITKGNNYSLIIHKWHMFCIVIKLQYYFKNLFKNSCSLIAGNDQSQLLNLYI